MPDEPKLVGKTTAFVVCSICGRFTHVSMLRTRKGARRCIVCTDLFDKEADKKYDGVLDKGDKG